MPTTFSSANISAVSFSTSSGSARRPRSSDTVSFAIRLINIPAYSKDTYIAFVPYVIVEDAEAFEAEEYGIAVAKENTELLEKLNTSIQKMLDEGKIDEWKAKYAVAE